MISKHVWFCDGCASKGISDARFPQVWFDGPFEMVGRVKQHPFNLVKNSFIQCIPL